MAVPTERVSVIIPARNEGGGIGTTVAEVVWQTNALDAEVEVVSRE